MDKISKAISVPDNDPRLLGAGPGMTQMSDGVLYVRQSDWLPFLRLVAQKSAGDDAAAEFWRLVTH